MEILWPSDFGILEHCGAVVWRWDVHALGYSREVSNRGQTEEETGLNED